MLGMTNVLRKPIGMKEPVLTSKIMVRPMVPQLVTFLHIQTLSFHCMQFKDVEDWWAVNKKAPAPSVAGIMKEAIAQHMGTRVISVEAVTISKHFVIVDQCLPA